jgi:hypothetical protein
VAEHDCGGGGCGGFFRSTSLSCPTVYFASFTSPSMSAKTLAENN